MVGSSPLPRTVFVSQYMGFFGNYVARLPVVTTYDNSTGGESFTYSTAQIILGALVRYKQDWMFDKAGNIEGGDAYLMTSAGNTIAKNDLIYGEGVPISISSIDGDATTISITTSSAHGLSAGQSIYIHSTTNYNGVYTVATVPTTTTLTIADTSHNVAAETSGKLVRDYNIFRVENLVTREGGFGSSQEQTYTFCNLFLYNDS